MAASSLLMGTFFGLLLAGYVTWVHGRRVGRIAQLIQVRRKKQRGKNMRKMVCNGGVDAYEPQQNIQN